MSTRVLLIIFISIAVIGVIVFYARTTNPTPNAVVSRPQPVTTGNILPNNTTPNSR